MYIYIHRNILTYLHMHLHTYTHKYLCRPWNKYDFFNIQVSSVTYIFYNFCKVSPDRKFDFHQISMTKKKKKKENQIYKNLEMF